MLAKGKPMIVDHRVVAVFVIGVFKKKEKMIDILIVGAGPIGLNCGIVAKQNGLSHLILDKGVLVNSVFNFPVNMTFFSTSNLLEIGNIPFVSHGDKPTRREAMEYFRRVREQFDLNVNYFEAVTNIEKKEGVFHITSSKQEYQAKQVILATGFYGLPYKMNIKGEDLPKVKHYYDEPHYYIGQKVLVVGAANSACDVAMETYYKNAEVTMAIRGDELSRRVKYWIKPNILNRIKEGSIKAYYNTTVAEIKEDTVTLNTPEGPITIENDFVLAMTGYRPDYEFFEKIGLKFHDDEFRTPKMNEETLETNIPGLFLAGVAAAGLKTSKFFIENTRVHAGMIIKRIMNS